MDQIYLLATQDEINMALKSDAIRGMAVVIIELNVSKRI